MLHMCNFWLSQRVEAVMKVGNCGAAAAAITDDHNRRRACLFHRHFWARWAFTLPLTGSACYEKPWWLQIYILCSILWLQEKASLC